MNRIFNIAYMLLLLGQLLSLLACKQQAEVEYASLSLSQTEMMHLSNEASEVTVQVHTSSGAWVALPKAEWLRTSKEGNMLHISVKHNPSTESRRGTVQVSSGGLTQELLLEQSGSSLEFNALKSIEFGQFGDLKKFYVDASSPTWQASTTADWIELMPSPEQGEISIKAKENTSRVERIAQVEIKDQLGQLIHSLEVRQEAILYLVMPHPEFGVNAELIRFFETERYSRLVNQPDFSSNFFYWGYETVSPIFGYIVYAVKNGKYVSASVYSTNRNPENLKGEIRAELVQELKNKGYERVEDGLYYNNEKNIEATFVSTTFNPNITFTAYPPQKPSPSFDELPLGLSKFYVANFIPREDDDPEIKVLKEGYNADEIIAINEAEGWRLIPPYDPTDPANAQDTPAEQERKRDESTRKIREPLFFGARKNNPNHWREFYSYLVFEKDGQYRAYEMAKTIEEYINNYLTEDSEWYAEFYGSKSRRTGGTALVTTRQTFAEVDKFFYWDDETTSLYVTKEFRALLSRAGYFYSSTIDAGRAFIYYNPETELELTFRLGNTLVDGETKPSVVVMQLAPRLL